MSSENILLVGCSEQILEIKTPVILTGHINRNKPAESFIDHPKAEVLYLAKGNEKTLLISIDALEMDTQICKSIIDRLSFDTNIPKNGINISCTHSHTVPAAIKLGLVDINTEFIKEIFNTLINCTKKAIANQTPCTILEGVTTCIERIAINRRKIINGEVVMAPNPEGIIDNKIYYCCFLANEEPKAMIVNYAMHPTTLDVGIFQISGDYPFYLREKIKAATGCKTVLFLNGACGDIRPDLTDDKGEFRGGYKDDMIKEGEILAKSIISSIRKSQSSKPKVNIKIQSIDIPLYYDYSLITKRVRKIDKDSYESKQINQTLLNSAFERWDEWQIKSNLKPEKEIITVNVVALTKQFAMVFLPGEIFTKTGLAIHSGSPYAHTMVVGYSNGTVGYIPTYEDYAIGGYEVQDAFKLYWRPAPFKAGTAEEISKSIIYNMNLNSKQSAPS